MKEILEDYRNRGLVYSQVHPSLPLTIYNYTDKVQYESLWDKITMMTRGLVVDNLGNIVAKPFKKFFNLSENKTTTTDNYEIFEKLDGSLIILFYFMGQWVFASKGSFTSIHALKAKEIFENQHNYNDLSKSNTYCFEIIFRENKIVVDYGDKEKLVLLTSFKTSTGEENDIKNCKLNIVKSYNLNTPLSELHLGIKDNQEGYVIKFSNGERCKIKGAEYLRLHKLISEMSTTAVWNCLKNNDSILNLITDFPDEFYQVVKDYEEKLLTEFELKLKEINKEFYSIISRKEFALKANDSKNKHLLFAKFNSVSENMKESVWNEIKPEYKRL